MRLIDADALIPKWVFGNAERDEIRNAPTVEAIPIEWIKEYAKLNKFETDDGLVCIRLEQIVDMIIEDFEEALTYARFPTE